MHTLWIQDVPSSSTKGSKIGRRKQPLRKTRVYSKVGPNTMLIAHATATRESKPKGERISASLCKTYMPTVVNLAMPESI